MDDTSNPDDIHSGAPHSEAPLTGPTDSICDGVATAELFASGQASAAELLDEAIARADRLNPQINAVIVRLDEQGRETAERLDALRDRNRADSTDATLPPLAGVPFLTKDLTCATEGHPYHAGNAALARAGHVSQVTTHLASMFSELGLVNFGRTNTPEFGLTITTEPLAYGPTANPWSTGHSTGGSSGGSAAAVAAGIVPVAHANDGGGSIRVPAANCGLFGLKPNRGRVSLGPDAGDGWAGFSVDGVVSRSVRDSARVLDGISRPWPGDPYFAPPPSATFESAAAREPAPLRIGLCVHSDWGPTDPECARAVHSAGQLLERLGHRVDVSAPPEMFHDAFFEHFRTIVAVCNVVAVTGYEAALGRPMSRADTEGDTWALLEMGRSVSGCAYVSALEWCHAWTRRLAEWWADHDVLVSPVLTEPPPRLGELRNPQTGRGRLNDLLHYTPQWNVAGQPAMSVPLHWSANGLPVGVQFVGPHAGEEMLLSLAGQLERATPWTARTPTLWAGNG
ncbi:amidase [Candidatus Poriferisodalis sp.]|uniref:amidase n=1 Tax=Candidatus Poriferisodalis sp. TaxID=3101277 RepID=UPI003B019D2B